MPRVKKKQPKRFNILVMRPRGGVITFSLSPMFILASLLFSLIFVAISIVIMNRYFILYLDHHDLKQTHETAAHELYRLQNLYSYQAMVSRDYANFVNMAGDEQADGDSQFIPLGSLPLEVKPEALDLLDAWAAFFPDPVAAEGHELEIDEFEVNGGGFKFRLLNEGSGQAAAKGRMLLLFTVLYPGANQLALMSYPDFDPQDRTPDFNFGIPYSVRSSKSVYGNLNLPEGARVVEMMAVAGAQGVGIVLKKKLIPTE